jgi:hypothetical protein
MAKSADTFAEMTVEQLISRAAPNSDKIYFCDTLPGFGVRLRRGPGAKDRVHGS